MIVLLADVELAAQDRLDALLLGRVKKVDCAVDVAVVCDGDGLLADPVHVGHQLVDVAGAVQQRIIRMQMKMCELSHV